MGIVKFHWLKVPAIFALATSVENATFQDPVPMSCRATEVSGQWVAHGGTLVGGITEKWDRGINFHNKESNSQDWKNSVTTTVQAGWSFMGLSSSVKVTGVKAHETSQSYSDSWSMDIKHDYSITWPSEYDGGQAWQFRFTTHDSCNHVETGLAKVFAVTAGQFKPPCCLPGYAIDPKHTLYQMCAPGTMVPGGEGWGCTYQEVLEQYLMVKGEIVVQNEQILAPEGWKCDNAATCPEQSAKLCHSIPDCQSFSLSTGWNDGLVPELGRRKINNPNGNAGWNFWTLSVHAARYGRRVQTIVQQTSRVPVPPGWRCSAQALCPDESAVLCDSMGAQCGGFSLSLNWHGGLLPELSGTGLPATGVCHGWTMWVKPTDSLLV